MSGCHCGHLQEPIPLTAANAVVCRKCWYTLPERRKNVFRDETTWTPEYRAGVMSAIRIQTERLLRQAQGLSK